MMILDKYKVTIDGKVQNTLKGNTLKTQVTNSGYELVHLFSGNKRKAFTVHRLVAMVFIPNPENKSQVNHKDGNKLNNHATNLEWVTSGENMRHSFKSGFSENSRERARERMRILGKKYAGVNLHHLLRNNIEISKPVLQMDLDGNLLKEFPSIKAAKKETGAQHINNVISGKYKQSKGFKWALKNA